MRAIAALLCLAAVVPFIPGAVEFFRRGIPDILFTGDGAALEFGTLHAAHAAQLLGPYSRFGWNHPGPAYFYLAAPVYELLDQRGPALNLFAFCVNGLAVIGIVLTAERLRGAVFALVVAALVSIYGLVGLPFLLANEWNPILPILPFVLLALLTARLSLGAYRLLPAVAFIASAIIQTHVAFAASVIALCIYALIRLPWSNLAARNRDALRSTLMVTIAVLSVCWILPLVEAFTNRPGNIQMLTNFFVRRLDAQHSWREAFTAIVEQLTVMPWAVAQAIGRKPMAAPSLSVASAIATAQIASLLGLLVIASKRDDETLKALASIGLILPVTALLSVRSISGDVLFYLVAWISSLGLLSMMIILAWLMPTLESTIGPSPSRALALFGVIVLLCLAVAQPVPRSSVFRQVDVATERLVRDVDTYLRNSAIDRVTVRFAPRDTWPIGVALALYLFKRGIHVHVDHEWLNIVGKPLAEPPGKHPSLLVLDKSVAGADARQDDASVVAENDRLRVLLQAPM